MSNQQKGLFHQGLAYAMPARDADQPHRAATPLELFYDLVFVVAIAVAAANLHHGIIENHIADALLKYLIVFWAICWAWLQFTWFASAYDNDDIIYRLLVFVQMVGALLIASGVQAVFKNFDLTLMTIGYVIIRLSMVLLWGRVIKYNPHMRTTAKRYMVGILLCQIGWVALLFLPIGLPGLCFLMLCELLVPYFAEKAQNSSWHPEHIAERYGLLTIIVLGESILAIVTAMQSGTHHVTAEFVALLVGALLLLFSMWWIYFIEPVHDLLNSMNRAFQWGYGHLLLFASVAAVGAGIAASIDFLNGHAEVGGNMIAASVGIPTALYYFSVWFCHERLKTHGNHIIWFLMMFLSLVAIWLPFPVLWLGMLGVALATWKTFSLAKHYQKTTSS